VLVFSQTDDFSTNYLGLQPFLQPFVDAGIVIDLAVIWDSNETYVYDARELATEYNNIKQGSIVDPHYEYFLTRLASVARNKEGTCTSLSIQ